MAPEYFSPTKMCRHVSKVINCVHKRAEFSSPLRTWSWGKTILITILIIYLFGKEADATETNLQFNWRGRETKGKVRMKILLVYA